MILTNKDLLSHMFLGHLVDFAFVYCRMKVCGM